MTGQVPFGTVITAGDVQAAVRAVLVDGFPDVLASVAAQHGFDPDDVPAPRGWGASAGPQPGGVDQRPVGVIVSPGIAGPPVRRGDGLYELRYEVAVGVVNVAATADLAQARCNLHAGALRATVLQHRKLGGLAASTRWTDERTEPVAENDQLAVWAATSVFEVTLEAAVDGIALAGPNPVVEEHRIDIILRRS